MLFYYLPRKALVKYIWSITIKPYIHVYDITNKGWMKNRKQEGASGAYQ